MASVLKDEQVKRLKQIDVQVAGTQAFAMPHVQEALKITDEQKEKIRDVGPAVVQGAGGTPRGVRHQGVRRREAATARQRREEYDKKLAAINKDVMDKMRRR